MKRSISILSILHIHVEYPQFDHVAMLRPTASATLRTWPISSA